MRPQNGGGSAIEVALAQWFVELEQLALPVAPLCDEVLADFAVILEQAGTGLLTGLGPHHAEAESQNKLSLAGFEIDFSGESEVAVFRPGVFPLHLKMLRDVLPAIREANEPD